MHQKQIYRLTIPYAPGAIKHIGIASGDGEGILGKTEKAAAVAVAVGFELARLVCRYAMWDQERDEWVRVEDFTGGVGDCGGRVEITGDREVGPCLFYSARESMSRNFGIPILHIN